MPQNELSKVQYKEVQSMIEKTIAPMALNIEKLIDRQAIIKENLDSRKTLAVVVSAISGACTSIVATLGIVKLKGGF